MLSTTLGTGERVRVWFRHQREGETKTVAYLQINDNQLYLGEAYVHPDDRFCFDTGRRLALKRVLRKAGFSKESRRVVWFAYLGPELEETRITVRGIMPIITALRDIEDILLTRDLRCGEGIVLSITGGPETFLDSTVVRPISRKEISTTK